jgi:hypothetical protein
MMPMEPKSQPTKPNISSAEPKRPPPWQVSASAWRGSEKTITIDELIEDQRQHLNSIDLCMLSAFSSRLRDKLKGPNADEYPGLRKAVDLIALVLESPVAQRARDPLPRWLAETAFAASYFLKEFDLVPALILQRVIERNRSELSAGLAEYID